MIRIENCLNVENQQIYNAFMNCSADYQIKLSIEMNDFINKYFGPEGNQKENSFVAFDKDIPIGLCIAGVLYDNNIKTMRCGVIAVTPEYRGTEVATKLMKEHIKQGQKTNCKQYLLEVLANNDRAISFYKKFGYDKVYDLTYRKIDRVKLKPFLPTNHREAFIVKEITLEEASVVKKYDYNHVIWRNSFNFFHKIDTTCYGALYQDNLVGTIIATHRKIDYIFVMPEYRNMGVGMLLLQKALSGNMIEKPIFSYTNNSILHLFSNHIKMEKTENNHIVMYKYI